MRLVADDESGIPRNLHNIVVSIHAIATFQALHDYLRPRVAGILGGGSSLASSRLSGMLSALSAFGRAQAQASGSSEPASQPAAESSSSASTTVARRRSQRLSAKSAATNNDEPSTTLSEAPQAPPAVVPFNPDTVPSETLARSIPRPMQNLAMKRSTHSEVIHPALAFHHSQRMPLMPRFCAFFVSCTS